MLTIKRESDLASLGLAVDPNDPHKVICIPVVVPPQSHLPIQIPDTGDLTSMPDEQLWARLKTADEEIKTLTKEVQRKELLLTAIRWRRGRLLVELKSRLPHGQFEKALKARKIKSQRASEDIRIAEHFPTEIDAGKLSVGKALKAIKRSEDNYGPYENCFATPDWVRKAIAREYGFPGLDVASSHGMHFGEQFYTPVEDGLRQDWLKDCGGKPVYCNPPYFKTVLGEWVKYAYDQSQRGCDVICFLPYWRNYPWFATVKQFAEVRLLGARVILDGFGPKEGKKCGNLPPREYESLIAVFRKDQIGFCGNWLDPSPT